MPFTFCNFTSIKESCARPLTWVTLFILVFFAFPLTLRAAFFCLQDANSKAQAYDVAKADMSSVGLLPDAASQPSARVLVMSAPLSGWKGEFLTHSWIVLKRANTPSWNRYEVLGYASRDGEGARNGAWLGNKPILNRYLPDGRWFGSRPTVLADVEGAAAEEIAQKLEAAIESYEPRLAHYRTWPGPNSNTFVATVLRAVPELQVTLPPTAVGKDFRPNAFFGFTDSKTGLELNLWGILGLKIGWVEGIELNVLGLVAGLDFRHPALKLPGFGRIDFQIGASDQAVQALRP